MFCEQCGGMLESGNDFCTNCGAKIPCAADLTPAQAPVPTPASKRWLIWLIIVAAAVVILAVLCLMLFGGDAGAKKTARTYIEAQVDSDYAAMAAMTAADNDALAEDMALSEYDSLEERYSYYAEKYDTRVRDMGDVYELRSLSDREEDEGWYGEDYETSCEVLATHKMSKEQLEQALEAFEDNVAYYELDIDDYLDTDEVTQGYYVWTTYSYKGDKNEYTGYSTLQVVKVDGEWKILTVVY